MPHVAFSLRFREVYVTPTAEEEALSASYVGAIRMLDDLIATMQAKIDEQRPSRFQPHRTDADFIRVTGSMHLELEHMLKLRNRNLRRVAELTPEFFLSQQERDRVREIREWHAQAKEPLP